MQHVRGDPGPTVYWEWIRYVPKLDERDGSCARAGLTPDLRTPWKGRMLAWRRRLFSAPMGDFLRALFVDAAVGAGNYGCRFAGVGWGTWDGRRFRWGGKLLYSAESDTSALRSQTNEKERGKKAQKQRKQTSSMSMSSRGACGLPPPPNG